MKQSIVGAAHERPVRIDRDYTDSAGRKRGKPRFAAGRFVNRPYNLSQMLCRIHPVRISFAILF
jgi:hypothetical protein